MSFVPVGSFAAAADTTSAQVFAFNPTATLEVGNLGVLIVGTENFGSENLHGGDDVTGEPTNTHQSITDSLGNIWVKWCEYSIYNNTQGAAGAISIWTCIPTTAITTADTITLTNRGTNVRKAVTGWEYTIGAGPLSIQAVVRECTTAGAPSALTLANMPSREYLIIHGITLETNTGNFTPDADYTAFTTAVGDTGTLLTSIQTSGEFRIATLTGDTAGATADDADFAQVMIALFEGEPTRPVHVGSSLPVNTSGTGTFVWPPHEIGDVAIIAVETQSETLTFSAAEGFQHITGSPFDEGTDTELSILWHRATSRAMAAPAFNDAGDHVLGKMHLFRGCIETGDPWDVIAGDVLATPSTTITVPGATTTVDQALALLLWVVDIVPTAVYLPDANTDLTELTRLSSIRAGGGGGGVGVATGYRAVAGSIAATTFTTPDSTSQARALIALKPEPSGAVSLVTVQIHRQRRIRVR